VNCLTLWQTDFVASSVPANASTFRATASSKQILPFRVYDVKHSGSNRGNR